MAAARAALIAGFSATSNLEAGRTWGIPTMGTAAHSFTLLHDSEEDAFRAQVAALGSGTTLLVDTYDVTAAVDLAVHVAGTSLGAVRIDSGDLPGQAAAVRKQLDELGATNTKITVTSDLDEFAIAALQVAPVDSYGVGTSVVTGSGAPTAGMVYKLVARTGADGEWVSVAKKSAAKLSVGGEKFSGSLCQGRDCDGRGPAGWRMVRIRLQTGWMPVGPCSSRSSSTVQLIRVTSESRALRSPASTAQWPSPNFRWTRRRRPWRAGHPNGLRVGHDSFSFS